MTPYLGHQVEPNPVARGLWHERAGAAHATLRRLPHRVGVALAPPPSSAGGVELERHASATAISTLGRRLASAVMAEADAGVDLVSSQQISAMAGRDRLRSPAYART